MKEIEDLEARFKHGRGARLVSSDTRCSLGQASMRRFTKSARKCTWSCRMPQAETTSSFTSTAERPRYQAGPVRPTVRPWRPRRDLRYTRFCFQPYMQHVDGRWHRGRYTAYSPSTAGPTGNSVSVDISLTGSNSDMSSA